MKLEREYLRRNVTDKSLYFALCTSTGDWGAQRGGVAEAGGTDAQFWVLARISTNRSIRERTRGSPWAWLA